MLGALDRREAGVVADKLWVLPWRDLESRRSLPANEIAHD
jgi:hypothetical protein